MFKKTLMAGVITIAAVVPGRLLAADAAPTPPAEKPAAEKPAENPPIFSIGGFDLTGFIDLGYTHFSSGSGRFVGATPSPGPAGTFAGPPPHARVFDFKDGFSFQNVDLQLARQPENGFGGLIDVSIGKDADTIASYGTIDKERGPGAGVDKKFDVTQAFLHYGNGPFTIIGGKFVTLAGAEVIKSRDNTNFSRSILFGYAIPFTHTGVRGTYKASDTMSFTVGVNEGWDTIQNKNGGATLELGTTLNPIKEFTLVGSLYTGREKIASYNSATLNASPTGTRTLIDLVGTYNVTDKLALVLNIDYGAQNGFNATFANATNSSRANWWGLAGYVNYTINDAWKISVRGEYFDDKDGYRSAVQFPPFGPVVTRGQKWKEGTFTVAYTGFKNFELRGELRFDRSDQNVFLNSSGATAGGNQNSVGLEAIYKF